MDLKDIPHATESTAITGIAPGEWYVAQRNGPARVLTASPAVKEDSAYVIPVEPAYPYSQFECFKITKEVYDQYREQAEVEFVVWGKQWWKHRGAV